jgi:bifunctional non-homologous end joining protein LigD
MLATLVKEPFDKKGWVFEIKFDGYRALAHKNKTVRLLSRNDQPFTQFPSIVEELKTLPDACVLDGEIVLLDQQGRSQFQLLQNYQRTKQGTPYYYVFDILSYKGKDCTKLSLIERKEILRKMLCGGTYTHLCYSDHIEEKGKSFFKLAAKKGLEGIVAKNKESTYQFRRSRDWLKIKTVQRQEVVIGGFTKPKGSRKYFGALLVGVYESGKLLYVANVGGGFNQKLLEEIYTKLQKRISMSCPFSPAPAIQATWVKPDLVCEVKFSEWTDDGSLRQPIFIGLRTDKDAKEVVRETPKS